jgi:phosphotransferase system enzyme I (PtsP)
VIGDVDGALKWAAPGDVALVDADHGFVILNPSRAEVASLRAWRKRAGHEADEAVPTLRTT